MLIMVIGNLNLSVEEKMMITKINVLEFT